MRQPSPRRWQSWRLTLAPRPAARAVTTDVPHHRMTDPTRPAAPPPGRLPPVPAELRAEAPDADGVRRGLVARVKQLIAAGEYDGPGVWEAAEERLFQRMTGGR